MATIESKVKDAITTFDGLTVDAQKKGLSPRHLMVLSRIGRLLQDQGTERAKQFDVRSKKLDVGVDNLMPGARDQYWRELETSYNEYNAWLKKLRGGLANTVKSGDDLEPALKQHFQRPLDVLNKNLDAISNAIKIEYKAAGTLVEKARGQVATAEQVGQRELENLHLRIRKACDEAEGFTKAYLAKPSEKSFMSAFASGQSWRTLATTKQLIERFGKLYGKEPWFGNLLKLWAGLKPETLGDVAQNKNSAHWEGVYGKFARDAAWWNVTQARVEANRLLTKELPKWRQFATDVKKLYKP